MTMLLMFCTVSLSAFAADETTESLFSVGDKFTFRNHYSYDDLKLLTEICTRSDIRTDLEFYYIFAIPESSHNYSGLLVRIKKFVMEDYYQLSVFSDHFGFSSVYSTRTGKWSNGVPVVTVYDDYSLDVSDLTLFSEFILPTGYDSPALYDFFTSLGSGLRSFLPSMASAGVNTIDVLFVRSDGGLTTVAIITIIGASLAAGLGVFTIIKRRMQKV